MLSKERAYCKNGLVINDTPNFWRVMYEKKEQEAIKTNAVLNEELKPFAFIVDHLVNEHGWLQQNFPLFARRGQR